MDVGGAYQALKRCPTTGSCKGKGGTGRSSSSSTQSTDSCREGEEWVSEGAGEEGVLRPEVRCGEGDEPLLS